MVGRYIPIQLRTRGGHAVAQRLTDALVRALERPAAGNRITYDSELKGFGARVTAAGSIGFIVNYRRRADGLERRYTIGAYPAWSVAAARKKAAELKRHIDNGGDPVGEHAIERGAPTIADLAERFLAEHVTKLRPHTQDDCRSMLRNDILPVLARFKVAAVQFEHIERLHASITKRAPVRANRALALVSKMFMLAIKWRMRADNPCRGVERNREQARRRYLSPEETARLLAALSGDPDQDAADAFRLLLLTGARKNEVMSAMWDQIDLDSGYWRKVPLSMAAKQMLAARAAVPVSSSSRVFDCDRNSLLRAWRRICRAAEISDARVHDLRHTHASRLASAGVGLHTIGTLLGHTNPKTTHRYAHLLDDPLRAATEKASALITGAPSAEIKPMKRRR
jgi:integrase